MLEMEISDSGSLMNSGAGLPHSEKPASVCEKKRSFSSHRHYPAHTTTWPVWPLERNQREESADQSESVRKPGGSYARTHRLNHSLG